MICCLLILSGCTVTLKDVSNSPEYQHLIGNKYALLLPLFIYGITTGSYANKVVDKYIVHNYQAAGPEVLSSDRLNSSTTFQVLKILRCTNCIFEEQIYYEIDISSGHEYKDAPVFITDISGIGNKIGIQDSNGKIVLDPSTFELEINGVRPY